MKKIKDLFFSEKKLSGAIFGILILTAFGFIFGPNIYAQFARQTGPDGWGYGYGYGYGYGGGFDGGTTAGYRVGGSAPTVYEYGYGYGFISSGVTHDSTNGYNVTPSNMADLVQSGIMTPNGGNIANTTVVAFNDKVTMTVSSGITVTIPSGTTFTSSSSGDFSALAAGTATTSDLANVNIAGSMSFGLPSLGLTVNPAITISINVGTSHNGETLNIYRKDASGSWAIPSSGTSTSCLVASGICTFTTTHLSSFATGSATSSGGGGGGGGGGGSVVTTYCTDVTYGDFAAACFAGYQYRYVTSRTPDNCTFTVAQMDASKKICGSNAPVIEWVNGVGIVEGGDNTASFIALEKNLIKKINKALAKRLSGRILLQVEEKGEAWYVNPVNMTKYYLGRPADAFAIMRKLALGVSNKDFDSFKGKAPARLAGRILLKVQDKGMAYYVNPLTLKMYYMGRPADAFSLMRSFGLGIKNSDLRQIDLTEIK